MEDKDNHPSRSPGEAAEPPDPEDGLRLVRTFVALTPRQRRLLLDLADELLAGGQERRGG
ncbi:MAG: hypothetical protein ACTHLO_19945 [Pseudolabrys sp.]